MMRLLSFFIAGLIFGLGLSISELVNPLKVLNFLDIFGTWDPSLLVVMVSALIVTAFTTFIVLKRPRPLLAPSFSLPTKKDIDGKLILGASIFGFGWGLVGICPGPTLAALIYGLPEIFIFLGCMLLGMVVQKFVVKL